MNMKSIGLKIRELRKHRGITLKEFSQKVGVTASLISQVERGVAAPGGELGGIHHPFGFGIDQDDIGIGAGPYCDGQLLNVSDMLGVFEAFTAKFVKKYANLAKEIMKAMEAYVRDVKESKFPENEHTYNMLEGEKEKLDRLIKSKK